jgi:hypothetical protein
MIETYKHKIPYFAAEIRYSDFIDFKKDKLIETLTGVSWGGGFEPYDKQTIKKEIIDNCINYNPSKNTNFVHEGELYLIKKVCEITLMEGILAREFIREFTRPEHHFDDGFSLKIYLIATLCRKVVNGEPEKLPNNLGEIYEFIEHRANELKNISLKNAKDFLYFEQEFETKISSPRFKEAFKSIHPTPHNIDEKVTQQNNRVSIKFGSWLILEKLLTEGLIEKGLEGLETPFFHCLFLYAINSNKIK